MKVFSLSFHHVAVPKAIINISMRMKKKIAVLLFVSKNKMTSLHTTTQNSLIFALHVLFFIPPFYSTTLVDEQLEDTNKRRASRASTSLLIIIIFMIVLLLC